MISLVKQNDRAENIQQVRVIKDGDGKSRLNKSLPRGYKETNSSSARKNIQKTW